MKEIDVLLPFHIENSDFYAAINSIQSSRGVKIRLILIDDRKEPKSLTNRPNSSTVINTFGAGYAGALNSAREQIHSPYTAIMNSDDLVHPDRFVIQIETLIDQDSQLCACGIQKFKNKKIIASQFGNLPTSGNLDRRVLLLGAYGVDATWCGKSDWWLKNLEFLDQKMSDWATGMEVSQKFDIYFCSEKLYYYRQHSNQTTADLTFSSRGLEAIMKKWLSLARQSNFQELSAKEVAWVAAPRGRRPLDKISVKRILDWLKEFDLATNGIYADLISRRLLLLLASYPLNRYELNEIFDAANAARSLGVEKFLNFVKIRKFDTHV
jgi:hypothetical protein